MVSSRNPSVLAPHRERTIFTILIARLAIFRSQTEVCASLHGQYSQYHFTNRGFAASVFNKTVENNLSSCGHNNMGQIFGEDGCFPTVWQNMFRIFSYIFWKLSSKNLAHQLIHYKPVQRVHVTTLKRSQLRSGTTYMYFGNDLKSQIFRKYVVSTLSKILGADVPLSPGVMLLADG